MQSYNIFTKLPSALPSGRADFLLAASVTATCEIEGITQAGIPGKIPLTPTLDAEYISNEKVFSLPELAQTPIGVPSPALITRAVHNLYPFSCIEILDLGLLYKPQNCSMHSFGLKPSESIAREANLDAKEVFAKGMDFGKNYELRGNYLILGESIPAGTTTAQASVLALGYDLEGCFSSSFCDVPKGIRQKTIQEALSHCDPKDSRFEKLAKVSDQMLLFCAGFLIEASKRFHIVLAGGTQMAACLLIADALREDILQRVHAKNITLATTQWILEDQHSDIKAILSHLSYTPHALYTPFSFASSELDMLKKYDQGEAKEGAGAGGALAYASTSGLQAQKLLQEIELLLYQMV